MLLIDYARDVVGLPLRGLYTGRLHVGYTGSQEKAERMREAGARVVSNRNTWSEIEGYEVSFPVGAEARAA